MDGTDWAEHYSLFDPDLEQREIEELNAALENERETAAELAWEMGYFSLAEATRDRERVAEYDRWVEEMHATTSIGALVDYKCPMSAARLSCDHRATLNPRSFLQKFRSAAKLKDIAPRLRCRKCGAKSPTLRFDPEQLD